MKSRFSCLFLLRVILTGRLMKSLQAARKRINRSIQVEHPFPYLHLPSPSPCPCLWVQLAFLREERSELPRRLGSTATLHRMTGTQLILHFPFSLTLPPPSPFSVSPFLSSCSFFAFFLPLRIEYFPIFHKNKNKTLTKTNMIPNTSYTYLIGGSSRPRRPHHCDASVTSVALTGLPHLEKDFFETGKGFFLNGKRIP